MLVFGLCTSFTGIEKNNISLREEVKITYKVN